MDRQLISSGTSWEKLYGYSRAVRVGNTVYVAGTTAVDETGQVIGINDPYRQARFIYEKIGRALAEAPCIRSDIDTQSLPARLGVTT